MKQVLKTALTVTLYLSVLMFVAYGIRKYIRGKHEYFNRGL